MAVSVKNANFFKYLQEAFRYKLYRDKSATSFKYLDYNLPYKSIGSIKGIFDYARKVLPPFYTNEFPNTEEGNLEMAKKILEKLDKRQDKELAKSFDPTTAAAENEAIIEEARQQSEATATTPEGTPATAPARPGPTMGGLPYPAGVGGGGGFGRRITVDEKGRVSSPAPPAKKTIETGLDYEGKPYEEAPSTMASKREAAEHKPAAKPATTTQSKVGRTFQAPRVPGVISSAGKNLGSATQRFIGTNLGRIGRGLGEIAGGVGRGIVGPGLTSASNLLVKTGNGLINASARFSNLVAGVKSKAAGLGSGLARFGSTGKKAALAFAIFGLFFGFSLFSAVFLPGQTTTPTASATNLLDYTLPLKDPSIRPQDIKNQVLAVFSKAKIEYWDLIVQKSIDAGFNPALALALWIEETGASQATLIKNGGSEILTNGELSKGHLGCAPEQDQTIEESLSCLFKFVQTNNFTNEQFVPFMEKYSSGPPGAPFSNNTSFPTGIKSWYARLVPTGPGALTFISTQTAAALGCPTAAIISNPYGYNIPDQPDTIKYQGCDNLSGCHNGLDFAAGPGTSIHATFDGIATEVGEDGLRGKYITISNSTTGFSATFEHLNSQNVKQGESIKRSQAIGTMGSTGVSYGVHLHYRLEKNGKLVNPLRYLGPSATIAPISLTQADDLAQNDYTGKPASFNWGQCNLVP